MMTPMRLPLGVKSLDANLGTFKGLAVTFGDVTSNGRVYERGAFNGYLLQLKSQKARTGGPALLPLLWTHDPNDPVGIITDAYETDEGLVIECACDLDTKLGRQVFSGIKLGYANGLSIGGYATRTTTDAQGVTHITEFRLREVSVLQTGYQASSFALADSRSAKARKDSNMNRNRNDDWKNQRVPLAPYVPNYPAAPPVPDAKDYADEEAYNRALGAWRVKVWGVPATPNSADEQRTQAERLQDHRAAQPNASIEDMQAYVKRHGHTPDGRKVQDTSASVERAYAAIQRKLAE